MYSPYGHLFYVLYDYVTRRVKIESVVLELLCSACNHVPHPYSISVLRNLVNSLLDLRISHFRNT